METESECGSFHAAVWDEERSKRSLVKWAGEEQDLDKTGNLRRAPTPFPKEMRAMAKKVQNLRDKKKPECPTLTAIRKKVRGNRPTSFRPAFFLKVVTLLRSNSQATTYAKIVLGEKYQLKREMLCNHFYE